MPPARPCAASPAWYDPHRAFVHFERLPGSGENYIVRAWRARTAHEPPLEIEIDTGQPWAQYDGTCVLCVTGTKCEVKAIMAIPDRAFWAMRYKIARELNVRTIWGERWIDGSKRTVRIQLPPCIDQLEMEAELKNKKTGGP